MMKKFFLCCVGSLLLCGCAETQYIKAGATQEDFEVDKVDCHNQVLMSTSGGALALGAMGKPGVGQGIATQSANQQARRDVDRGLHAKGWVPETK